MGRPATGELRPLASGGHEARIRIDDGVRRGFALTGVVGEEAARERCTAMAKIANRLRAVGHVSKSEDLMKMAAKARAGRPWEAVIAAVDLLCTGEVKPLDDLDPIPAPNGSGVYFLHSRAPTDSAIKIGHSTVSIRDRLKDLVTAHPWPTRLVAVIKGATRATEYDLHHRFSALRIRETASREWFRFDGELRSYVLALRGDSSCRG